MTEATQEPTPALAFPELSAVERYVRVRQAKPMRGQDPDIVHEIHIGTPFEARITLSDLEALLAQVQALTGGQGQGFSPQEAARGHLA